MKLYHFIFFFSIPLLLTSQEPSYKQYLAEDGLPSTTIFSINQDSRGLLWLATEKGMCSFDGYDFRTYQSDHYQDYDILDFDIDEEDRIWHFNLSGDLYVISDSEVKPITNYHLEEHPVTEVVASGNFLFLQLSVNGAIRLAVYELNGMELSFIKEFMNSPAFGNSSFSKVKDQLISYESSLGKINIYGIDLKTLLRTEIYCANNSVSGIYSYDGKDFILTNLNEIYYLSPDKRLSKIGKNSGTNSIRKSKGQYFITSDEGLEFLNFQEDSLVGKTNILTEFQILNFWEDTEGSYWLGTRNDGLIFIPNSQSFIYNEENSPLMSSYVKTITRGENNLIYVGLNSGEIAQVNDGDLSMLNQNFGNEINCIIQCQDRLIVASNRQLNYYNLSDNTRHTINTAVKDLNVYSQNKLLVGASGTSSIYEIDTSNNKLNGFKTLTKNRTYAVSTDCKGRHWTGSVNALYVISNNGTDQVDTILNHNISDIKFSSDNSAYVSTYSKGLYKIVDLKPVMHYSSKDQLSSDNISDLSITKDQLYISTDKGLNILNLRTEEITLLSTSDGIPTNEINDAIPIDSFIWIATSKGLCKMKTPEKFTDSESVNIKLNRVLINGIDNTLQDSYELTADQNSINLSFSTPDYSTIDHLDYYSRSVDSDTTWKKLYENKLRIQNLNMEKTLFMHMH